MRKWFLALLAGSMLITQPMLNAQENVGAPDAQQPTTTTEPAPTTATGGDVDQATRDEIIRRQESQLAARKLIDQGMKLYYDGRFEEAAAKLEQALAILPRAKVTEIDYNRAAHGLSESLYRLADDAYRATPPDFAKAKQLAQKALVYDPSNRSAENLTVKIKQAEREEKARAEQPPPKVPEVPLPSEQPEFIAKQDEIKTLFREGKLLMNSGQYNEAEVRFKQVLLIDPYNADAYAYLTQLSGLRISSSQSAAEASRAHMLWQVENAWVPPIGKGIEMPTPGAPGGPVGPGVKAAEITQKLNEIVLPEVNFREAVISDVINFLVEESRRLDPTHTGINMVLSTRVAPAAVEGAPPPTVEGQPPVPTPEVGVQRITLNLRNVPIIDALKYITTQADLKYRIESSAVIILPLDAPEGPMVTRVYHVTPGVFISSAEVTNYPSVTRQTQTQAGGGGQVQAATALVPIGPSAVLPEVYIAVLSNQVQQLFIDAGVEFPPGSTLLYYDRTSTIITRNTPENLEVFERVLAAINAIPHQVEIEAKFVEIAQQDLDELAFQWRIGPYQSGDVIIHGGGPPNIFETGTPDPSQTFNVTQGLRTSSTIQGNAIEALLAAQGFGSVASANDTIGTIRGILTDPQFQVVIQALSQKASADILIAPKVATISGKQAQIRVSQEFIYPSSYTPPQATAAGGGTTGGGSAAVVPSIPDQFSVRDVGVVFNVTPTVGADGYTISLTLIPQLTDFLGFIQYGGPISIAAGDNVVTTLNDIRQPLFSTRDVFTSVVIWDGQTVVLGGLIRDTIQKLDDKVPFLGDIPMIGRLFRSKVTSVSKRNLLIFVTARLIDPAGNPIHRQETASLR